MKTTSVRLTEELHVRVQASELTIPQLIERGLDQEETALKLVRLLWEAVDQGGRLIVVQPGQKIEVTTAGEQPDSDASPEPAYCRQCDTDTHTCPGCGRPLKHGGIACAGCLADSS